jgi:hypothetical protein
VDIRPVDPRDIRWEIDDPAYRVYFWHPRQPGSGWVCEEWEITGADVAEVQKWAAEQANGRRFVVYARAETADGPGLIRLQGTDPLG